jgi:hypothetical protein
MPPYQPDPNELLRLARARAEELRHDWQVANGGRRFGGDAPRQSSTGPLRAARAAAGRTLIGLGRRVLPVETEPCG